MFKTEMNQKTMQTLFKEHHPEPANITTPAPTSPKLHFLNTTTTETNDPV